MIIKKTRNSGQFYSFWYNKNGILLRTIPSENKAEHSRIFIVFSHVLENYEDTIVLIFPYDIVIGSGFEIYKKEVDFCLIFSIWKSSS